MKKSALKSGLVFAVIGGLVTLLVTVLETWDFGLDQHSELVDFRFWHGMNVIGPSIVVGRALGIKEGKNAWEWHSLAVAVNATACFSAGALVGAIARGRSASRLRLPAVLWPLLIAPIALLWVVALPIFPAAIFGAFLSAEFAQFAGRSLLLVVLSIVLYGLICCRPFWRAQGAEPGATPNAAPPHR